MAEKYEFKCKRRQWMTLEDLLAQRYCLEGFDDSFGPVKEHNTVGRTSPPRLQLKTSIKTEKNEMCVKK